MVVLPSADPRPARPAPVRVSPAEAPLAGLPHLLDGDATLLAASAGHGTPVAVPEAARPLFAEKVHDLPAVITMEPITELDPASPPMLRNGYVTFGVFNRIDKISDEALELWSALMRAVPGSKIIVKNGALDDHSCATRSPLVSRRMASARATSPSSAQARAARI